MKKNWVCTECSLVFSRKWNLQRHHNLIHGFNSRHYKGKDNLLQNNFQQEKLRYDNVEHDPSYEFSPDHEFKEIVELAKLQNTISNSAQTFGRINSLEQQVSTLQQQVRFYEKQIFDFVLRNWLLSKGEFQGISGYVCNRCKTFSFRPILDPGYDMTMQAKHRCEYGTNKTSYIIFPIPLNIEKVDDWAAQVLLDYLKLYLPIGKYLASYDISRAFVAIDKEWNSNASNKIIGIPDRYYFYSLEKEYKIGWIDRALANLGKKILMSDTDLLDFFRRVKSTYAIFEIPARTTIRRVSMKLTAYPF